MVEKLVLLCGLDHAPPVRTSTTVSPQGDPDVSITLTPLLCLQVLLPSDPPTTTTRDEAWGGPCEQDTPTPAHGPLRPAPPGADGPLTSQVGQGALQGPKASLGQP